MAMNYKKKFDALKKEINGLNLKKLGNGFSFTMLGQKELDKGLSQFAQKELPANNFKFNRGSLTYTAKVDLKNADSVQNFMNDTNALFTSMKNSELNSKIQLGSYFFGKGTKKYYDELIKSLETKAKTLVEQVKEETDNSKGGEKRALKDALRDVTDGKMFEIADKILNVDAKKSKKKFRKGLRELVKEFKNDMTKFSKKLDKVIADKEIKEKADAYWNKNIEMANSLLKTAKAEEEKVEEAQEEVTQEIEEKKEEVASDINKEEGK